MSNRKVILCFIEFYYPGYRSGGPVRSIENFVSHFSHEFDIKIVCRDRDLLDKNPYPFMKINAWNDVGNVKVFYASSKLVSLKGINRLLKNTHYDLLYLNSFFCYGFTILPLLSRRFSTAEKRGCIIAPRGELAKEALRLKALKKSLYMYLSRIFGFYDKLFWQVSSEEELNDVYRQRIVGAGEVIVAPDLLKMKIMSSFPFDNKTPLKSRNLRIIFVSRISPIKNLDFLLITLSSIKVIVELDIYGPFENENYWTYCKKLISKLPKNIIVNVHGPIMHSQIQEVFSKYDLFAFPTKGENFGHVIFESLSAGTPVIVSDRTPWRSSLNGGLSALPLDQAIWHHIIMDRASCTEERLSKFRRDALFCASAYLANDQSVKKTRELLLLALGDDKNTVLPKIN